LLLNFFLILLSTGKPEPLGPSKQGSSINFAIYAKFAKSVTLVLFDEDNQHIADIPVTGRTGKYYGFACCQCRDVICCAMLQLRVGGCCKLQAMSGILPWKVCQELASAMGTRLLEMEDGRQACAGLPTGS
jgi:hypothetical protein